MQTQLLVRLALLLLAMPRPGFGQGEGTITVRVIDTAGTPFRDYASVSLEGVWAIPKRGPNFYADFRFDSVPAGQWVVLTRVSLRGLRCDTVLVRAGETVHIDARLRPYTPAAPGPVYRLCDLKLEGYGFASAVPDPPIPADDIAPIWLAVLSHYGTVTGATEGDHAELARRIVDGISPPEAPVRLVLLDRSLPDSVPLPPALVQALPHTALHVGWCREKDPIQCPQDETTTFLLLRHPTRVRGDTLRVSVDEVGLNPSACRKGEGMRDESSSDFAVVPRGEGWIVIGNLFMLDESSIHMSFSCDPHDSEPAP